MIEHRRYRGKQTGISYIEVLIAVVLIAISLVPMSDAVRTATIGTNIQEETAVQQLHLVAMLENVLAEPFSSLEAAATAAGSESVLTIYSDSSGSTNRRLVFLSLYDGDNADTDDDPFTGTDQGLMWVRVEIEDTARSIETLTSQ